MSFRTRLTLVATGAVAATLVIASIIIYVAVAASTRSEVDDGLRRQMLLLAGPMPGSADRIQGDGQMVTADGEVTPLRPDSLTLPFVSDARAVASGQKGVVFHDVHVVGSHLRVLIGRVSPGRAVELAAPLDRVDQLLHRLLVVLLIVGTAGVVIAGVTGRVVAQAALAPVVRLRAAAKAVASARRPGTRVPVEGDDELADLATSFNDMVAALERSLDAQRTLVADASHELRTPLTSLRTNVEFLLREPGMEAHAPLLNELRDETEDLGLLVADLIELARHEGDEEPGADVRLDELTATAVVRAQRRAPTLSFVTDLHPVTVIGVPGRIDRAITNVIDNAVKWSPPGGSIEIGVAGGELVVRDHGPGIPAADLPHVFNRFYRSGDSHRLPGSGLGLAIVRQVADAHGGTVSAERAPDGGTRVRLWFPESTSTGV